MLSKHLLEWGFPQKSVRGHRTDFCRWFSLHAAHENHLGLWKLFRLRPWLEMLINLSGGVIICSSWGLIPGGIDRIETFTVFLIFLQGVCPVSQPLKPHAGPARPHPALWAPALPTWAQSPACSTVRLPSLWPKPIICLRFFFTKWLPGSPSIAKLTSSLQYSLCGFCDYRKKRE